MISSSCEAILVNEKIVTFLIVKLCYNGSSAGLVGLCDVMSNLIESEELTQCVREALCGKLPSYKHFCCINKALLRNLRNYLMVHIAHCMHSVIICEQLFLIASNDGMYILWFYN